VGNGCGGKAPMARTRASAEAGRAVWQGPFQTMDGATPPESLSECSGSPQHSFSSDPYHLLGFTSGKHPQVLLVSTMGLPEGK
jgi:hypothetical protein